MLVGSIKYVKMRLPTIQNWDAWRIFAMNTYREDIGLQQAADIVNLERTYFCKFFHEKVGVCFNCWFSILRIERAKEHLRTRNYPIYTIVNKVGFNSLSTFERTFKRCTGMTASQYRKQIRPC